MPQGNAPANAQAMHDHLQELGVVERVRRVLMAANETLNVTDLTCWVERDRGDLYVKAAYMHHRKNLVSGKPSGKHTDFARFRVGQGVPFGPIGSPPLPNTLVTAIQGVLPA